jgi:hypothetical protein
MACDLLVVWLRTIFARADARCRAVCMHAWPRAARTGSILGAMVAEARHRGLVCAAARRALPAAAVALLALLGAGADCGPDGHDDVGDADGDSDARPDAKPDAKSDGDAGDAADAGPPCSSDFDCLSPAVCEELHCAPPCGAARACEQGYLCTEATGHCEVDPACEGLTWRTFARGFTADYCVRCHAGYSDLAVVRSIAAGIVDQVVTGSMPESCPCPTQPERENLSVWVTCGMPR